MIFTTLAVVAAIAIHFRFLLPAMTEKLIGIMVARDYDAWYKSYSHISSSAH